MPTPAAARAEQIAVTRRRGARSRRRDGGRDVRARRRRAAGQRDRAAHAQQRPLHLRRVRDLAVRAARARGLRPAARRSARADRRGDGQPDRRPVARRARRAWRAVLARPEARLHLYGKDAPAPGRKMGHVAAARRRHRSRARDRRAADRGAHSRAAPARDSFCRQGMATLVYSDVDGVDRSFALGAEPVHGRPRRPSARSAARIRACRACTRGSSSTRARCGSRISAARTGSTSGRNKVQRAPVPTGEIVLVGSLMIRLLPASGTLPPPIGLHGTLAQWLEMERKARAAVEDERDAFAKRVGELHEQLRGGARTTGGPESCAGCSTRRSRRAAPPSRRGAPRSARPAAARRARRAARARLARARGRALEIAKAREAKMIAETQAGLAAIEKLAEADLRIAALQHELDTAKKAAAAASNDLRVRELEEQLAPRPGAPTRPRRSCAAQIRAQGAERNLRARPRTPRRRRRAPHRSSAARRHEGQARRERRRARAGQAAAAVDGDKLATGGATQASRRARPSSRPSSPS